MVGPSGIRFLKMHPTNDMIRNIVFSVSTQFRGGLIYQIFERIGVPRPNKDNLIPCPYIPMQWTEQAGRGPSVVSILLEYMGMVLDCPCLVLEAQSIQKNGK